MNETAIEVLADEYLDCVAGGPAGVAGPMPNDALTALTGHGFLRSASADNRRPNLPLSTLQSCARLAAMDQRI